jgi:hypothetical protein
MLETTCQKLNENYVEISIDNKKMIRTIKIAIQEGRENEDDSEFGKRGDNNGERKTR